MTLAINTTDGRGLSNKARRGVTVVTAKQQRQGNTVSGLTNCTLLTRRMV